MLDTGILTAVPKMIDFRILQATMFMTKSSDLKSNVTVYAGTIYVVSFQTAEINCDVNYFLDSFVWEVEAL